MSSYIIPPVRSPPLPPYSAPVRFQVHNIFFFLFVISSDDRDLLSPVFVRHIQVSIAFHEEVHITLNIASKGQIRVSKHALRCNFFCDIKPRNIRNVKDVLGGPAASIIRIHSSWLNRNVGATLNRTFLES